MGNSIAFVGDFQSGDLLQEAIATFGPTEEDTPDKIDYEKLARVVSGLVKVISNLAEKQL